MSVTPALSRSAVRIIVVTGTGGAGVTTLAAATAALGANRGLRTLLFAASESASLPLVLDHEVGDTPVQVDTNLYARQFGAQAAFESAYQLGAKQFRGPLGAVGIDPPDPGELSPPPGARDILMLHELVELHARGDWDLVVVDAPPLAAALRLLSLPDSAQAWLQRVRPAETQAARALRPVLTGLAGLPSPQEGIVRAGDWVRQRLSEARDVLTGPGTSVRLVTTAERIAFAAVCQARTALALHGMRLDGVVLNRVLAAASGSDGAARGTRRDTWRSGWAAAHQSVIDDLTGAFDGVPVSLVPYRGAEPVGLEELSVLATAAYGPDTDALAEPGPAPEPQVRAEGDQYVLAIPLPLADRRAMDLVRRGDELTVTVGAHRRSLELPPVLKRCTVSGASLRQGSLLVRFVPDPAQWPQQQPNGHRPGNAVGDETTRERS